MNTKLPLLLGTLTVFLLIAKWKTCNESEATEDLAEIAKPPPSRVLLNKLETEDSEKTTFQEEVSQDTFLLNLSLDNTTCKDIPKFEKSVTEYECVFWWSATEMPRVIPTLNPLCRDCVLLMPSPERSSSHLSLSLQTQKEDVWESGRVWTRRFFYGESHILPIVVLSGDRSTNTTYRVHLERDAPWWMKTSTEREISSTTKQISFWASVVAYGMAMFSASTFLALTRLIQFMDLTTEIKGTPQVYQEFAENLEGLNFDLTPYLPDLGLPTLEDVKMFKKRAVQMVKESFVMSEMRPSSDLVLQYCYASAQGLLAGNGILHLHPEKTKILMKSLEEVSSKNLIFKNIRENQTRSEAIRGMADETSSALPAPGASSASSAARATLRGSPPASSKGHWQQLKDTLRRLNGEHPGDDKEDTPVEEVPDSHIEILIFEWTESDWKAFMKKTSEAGVTEKDFPEARKIPCLQPPLSDLVNAFHFAHKLELLRQMMHSNTATFILMFLFWSTMTTTYSLYYWKVMKHSQRRLKWLEPGFLAILALDCGLISFTKSAVKMMTQPSLVTFFFWRPESWTVRTFVAAALLGYPVVFILITFYLVYGLTKGDGHAGHAAGHHGRRKELVFNVEIQQWIDPTAQEVKVDLEPPIPSWFPVVGEFLTSHVRSCVPVLAPNGRPINFKTDVEEVPLAKVTIDKAKLEEESVQLFQDLTTELHQSMTKQTEKARMRQEQWVQQEKDLNTKKRERQLQHRDALEQIKGQLAAEEATYGREEDQLPWGPLADPSWFPSSGEVDEEEIFVFQKVSLVKLFNQWTSQRGRNDFEVLDAEESVALRSYLEGFVQREKELKKYNIMEVSFYKGFLLPREPYLRKNEEDQRIERHPRIWWLPKDVMQERLSSEGVWLGEYAPLDSNFIANPSGQRLVIESHTLDFLPQLFGRFKLGDQPAGWCYWLDEPQEGWEMFASAVRRDGFFQKGTARITYATKWHWIYLDQWDLPWSAEERSLLKRFKHLVPLEMSRREKDEIRRWVWQKLLPCATVKMKLSWMSRHHPLYYNEHDTMLEVVEKPFEDFLLDLAHAKPIEDTAARPVADELLHFSLMKFQDLYLDEPWWDDSDKPDEGERKIMFDHAAFFQDGTFDSRWMQRREESPLIPENGYHSSSCFTRFPEDTLGKKRYIIKKPDGWSSQMEMKVQLKHVPPLMRYTNKFKACVPLESLELPLSSSFAFMLKGSGKGEQFNYTLDRLTTMITIGVLAVQLPGPLCVMILFCLLLLASISRFYTKLTSMQDEKGTENTKHGYVPLTNEPMLSHSAAARVTSTDWVAAMGKVVAIFLEMEVFALFMQSLVLGFLAMDLIGLMSPSLCAIGCILTCVMAMIMMTLGTFRKELKKSIENISESMSQLYGVAKSYQVQAMIWLNLGSWGIDFHDFGTQNVNSVSFVVSELGVRLVGKPLVDDLLPAEEKRRQQVIKHNAYFVKGKGSNSRSGVPECAADLVRWYQDISPNFPIALSMDQLNRRKCIPSVAATLQCVNHAGRRMSHPDLDSYLTPFYPEEWEDENDNDPEAVKFLLEMWRVQVKEWMENSLGAVYSERTWTKKIQEHISALMAMPFQMSSQFVMIKVEHLLIPNAKPKMSWRKEILDRLEGKMLYVTILYDDEDFLSDLPPGRSSGYARIERLADEKKKDLIRDPRKERTSSPEADAGSEEKRPLEADLQQMGDLARFRALMEDEGDEMPDFIELEDLKHFGYWCQHQDEFKVRLPATANQFKLMVWMQHNVDGKMTEELLGISDPFDLILPEDLSSMGADEADQRRIYFYSSWTTESGRLQRIQESSKDQTENHSFFPETKRKVRDYFNPPITKSDVRETMGFVDFKVRPASQEENDEDEEALIAVRDVVAGSSELNKAKLRRHLDRQTIFAKFFGLAMEVDSSLEEHLDKLKEFRATHQSGALFLKELRMETGHKEKLEMSLLENNIRRSLWERDAMDKAIKSLEKGIAELKKKKQKNLERQKGMEAVESYRIQERWRGSFCTHETVMDFESALLLQLQTFRQGQQSDFTSILHYVLMADDVKPNKVGRPDSVPPHMCEIVCNTVQDVPRVQLRCSQFSSDVVFKRETNGSNGDGMPALVNARLCFQAVGAEAEKYYKAFAPEPGEWMIVKDAEDANLPEWKPVFLYWDGFARWVVSPFRGEPAPYGLKTDQNQGLSLYVRDSASSPDRIKKGIFMKWHVEAGVAEWKEDPSITVISKFNWKSFGSSKGQQLATHAKTVDQSGQSSTFGKIFNALMFVFVSTSSKKTLPEIKDGLIGLEGRNIIFAWKDLYQESLAPFRSFLLEEFGSYHAAWVFLCRNCTISKSRCVRNLARMLKRCHEETQAALKARAQAAGKGKKKFQRDRSMREGISQGHVQEKRSMMDHDERKKKANLFLSMLGKAMVEKASPVKEESNEEKALERMQEYLHARVAGGSLEAICQELLNQLDHNENGNLEVHEILSLEKMLEEKLGNKEMKEFLSFLKVHPRWSNVEHFWLDLSEGFEISKEEFVRDSRLLLLRFTNQQMIKGAMPDVSIESRVELIFSQLDVQMSGGVGLKELIPMSGEGLADVQSNLAKFKIPLDYLKEIRIEGDAHDDRPYLRFQVHPDFESSPEWRSLKMGLSPDWEPNQGLEYLRVGMAPHHLDVWKRVILDWGMDDSVVQESIRFYQGRTISHPTIDGVHMRSGKGVQRWPDGKMYCGYWDDHLYNGEGSLFNDYQDMTRGVNPIYKGEWQRGKRHGWGVFRWEQGAPEGNPHGAGQSSEVFKVYEGEFVNDLFNGQGSMKVENAPFVTTTQHQGVGPGCVPLPCLDPVSIMSFEGTWASDWYQADEEARASSSLYDHLHPKEEEAPRHEKTAKLHLNLHNIKSTQSKDPKFLRYFSADSLGVQRAGKPLPDLALAYYQQQGCDAKHMTKGRALYADFTVYIGDYACGVPDGSGEMTQYEYNGTKGKPLAHYKGYWKNGQFHGAGRYQTADGLTYDGQFVENLRHGFGVEEVSKDLALKLGYGKYEGEWKNGVFHGQGRLTSADGRVFEGHFVEGQRQAGGRELKPETKGLPNLFGSMLKKPKVDGEDVLHAPDELRFLHETIGQLRHRPRSAPEPPSDLEDVIIKGGTGENEVMNGVYFRLTHTFGHRVFKMVKKVGIFQSVVRYLYLDDASESWVISAQPLSGICSASGCAFVPEDAKHPSLVTKPWYVWHGFSKTLRVVGEECEEEEDERQTFSLGSLRGTPSPVDLLEAKSIIGFQLTGHADGEVVLGMMRRIPMIQFGRPVYAHQSGGQYLYFHRKGSTNKWDGAFQEELGPGIDPKPKLYEDRGYWIFAAELGNLPESPGCHGFVEDNAVTPDQISGTWKVKVADQMQRSPALKLVPREWSDEHLLHDTGTSGAARTMVRS